MKEMCFGLCMYGTCTDSFSSSHLQGKPIPPTTTRIKTYVSEIQIDLIITRWVFNYTEYIHIKISSKDCKRYISALGHIEKKSLVF